MMRWTAPLFGAVLLMTVIAPGAVAQDIDDLDEGVVLETPFEPGIEPGVWELSMQVGYIDLSNKFMGAEGIIIDLEDPQQAIFADMELSGASSFHPQVRVGRTLGNNFVFENSIGFSIGDFEQSVTGDLEKWVDQLGTNEFTDVEREQGSYFAWMHEHSLAWYPRGEGRVQPFLVGGVGTSHYTVDSKYIEGTTGNFTFSVGGGLRVVGDDLYSLRLEVRQYFGTVEFTPGSVYEERPNLDADALINFPVSRLVDTADLSPQELARILAQLDIDPSSFNSLRVPQPVESFESESFSNLWISLGFVAAF